ncbi:exosome complex exonuclease rrp6-like [Harmonia axyridis]|uniref:exosome complex exonuclease rrp6-like n=1 Tax=Harmonia axyridis TaxID=115357 RepID=UPI001E2760C3|nr:exosome complex exonuclease rrp6-like [Harmonia axyridis]
MADENELKALGDNDAEIFDEMKDIVEGEEEDFNEDADELEHFLNENKLQEHLTLFRDQQIDFETLMILTETDLKSLGLPLGPFRKLTIALQKKKNEIQMESEGVDEAENHDDSNSENKGKDDSGELPTLADESNFRVIDESGDDSDAHSVKSEHAGGKKEAANVEPDKNHPYKYDLINFKPSEEFNVKVELQEPANIETKPFELITEERRLKSAIKALRKEKIIAVDARHNMDTYEKSMNLMMISTQNTDYIIDFSKMNHLILLLTEIFTNPNILKVFYEARHEVKFLQRCYNLFTVNAYCVRSAVKELKYETSSLYGLINKYVSYFKPTDSDCSYRPLKNDIKTNLRKETHYLLHIYYKTRNEAIEAGIYDKVVAIGAQTCMYLTAPVKERKPENIFSDFEKFNDAQKLAAEELCAWRETLAKDRNVDVNVILSIKDFKQICLSLPIKKEELLMVVNTRIVRMYFTKLLAILKAARKKYFKDPKDESKYDLRPVPSKPIKKPMIKSSPKPNIQNSPVAAIKTDLKRKSDGFVRPLAAKKGRFSSSFRQGRRNFSTGNKSKSPMTSPFRGSGGYRGGYHGNSGKNYGQNSVKYPNPQNVWEPQQNQNFNNYGGGGFKYY